MFPSNNKRRLTVGGRRRSNANGPRSKGGTRMMHGKTWLWVSVGLASLIAAHAATAQTASSGATPGAHDVTIQEVVVTAERRAETVQKTPLAITALTPESLRTLGVTSATSLNSLVPGLEIGGNGGGSLDIFIRGIGSTNDTEVGDPAVAFNVDGVYMARSRSANGLFYDIDRIEVLRGPQGTLYGRNATAGAINVITKQPTDSFAGAASVEVGDYGEFLTSGMVNVPVYDKLSLRAAFQTSRHDSYSDNGYNDEDSQAGRVQALFKPTDNFSALLMLDRFQSGGVGAVSAPLGEYSLAGDSPYHFAVSAPGSNRQVDQGVTLTLNWQLSFATLTYVGSYREDDVNLIQGSADNTALGCVAATGGAPCTSTNFQSREDSTSHELRLAGSTDRLKWVAGLYYFHEHNNVFAGIYPIAGINSLAFVQPDVSEESKAAFAQATYSVTDRFRLTGGLRYTDDTKARTGATMAFGSVVGYSYVGGFPLYLNNASYQWRKVNWKAGAEYDITSTSLAYASVGTGYKAGGYGDGPPSDNHEYGPENLTAYEVGVKNTFLDHRLLLNLSGFYYDYEDFQVTGLGVVAGQPSSVTVNAQKAELYGVELEGAAVLTEHDRIDGNVSYLHSDYTKFVLAGPDSFGRTTYTGEPLAHTPSWSLNGGYQHTFDLGEHGRLTARLQERYVSEQNLDYHNFAVTRQGAYSKTDLTLTYDSPDRKWDVMAYARNLENRAVLVYAAPDAQNANSLGGSGTYAPPRTFGVRADARF